MITLLTHFRQPLGIAYGGQKWAKWSVTGSALIVFITWFQSASKRHALMSGMGTLL